MNKRKEKMLTKNYFFVILLALLIMEPSRAFAAGGLFGPPQTVSRGSGGLNTAIGYLSHEDVYKNNEEHVIRQNKIYSQVAYGSKNIWEIYGRIGISDLKTSDAFRSSDVSTTTAKNDFEENWKFFGTLGAKGFYPVNKIFGIGAFIQGTYNFSNYTDEIAGISNAAPYRADMKIKNLWDVNLGIGFQATIPCGAKFYAGPYLYYSEADVSLDTEIPGLDLGTKDTRLRNASITGGFIGADIPLAKGFRLNIEGQFARRFSLGAAVTYTY